MKQFFVLLSTAALVLVSLTAKAEYPEKPIHIIVPFAPGGNIDLTARYVAPGLSEILGKPVIVENRPGAGGLMGCDYVAKSAPDGYTLLLGSTGGLATAVALNRKLQFDPLKDYAPAPAISRVPLVMVINPALPAKTVSEFVALAKARPGTITYASPGNGTSNHLAGELFRSVTGTKLIHVPYKGSGQYLPDVVAGHTDFVFDQMSTSITFIKSGKLRALGVTTLSRVGAMPELPTLAESGLREFEASTTTGLLFPAATPAAFVARINDALTKVLMVPDTRERFVRIGADVVEGSPDQFDRIMRQEIAKWTKVVREANIKIE